MNQASSIVRSSQAGVHSRLEEIVRRHLASEWRQPLHPPTVEAFDSLLTLPAVQAGKEFVLDSGCGTGDSTRQIAQRHPDALVIGVDRSASRLSRLGADCYPHQQGNAVWLQAELATFWRLAGQAGWRSKHHYLLYPNPWPKPGQLQRRWHAHPVFPDLLRLGGILEVRCNWQVYAEELVSALKIALGNDAEVRVETSDSDESWGPVSTPFERKYARSGHRLFRVTADLGKFVALLDNDVERD